MPFELGIFLGMQKVGNLQQQQKKALILVERKHDYQKFISDLSGIDPAEHYFDRDMIVRLVRTWLSDKNPDKSLFIDGEIRISKCFEEFERNLPEMCKGVGLNENRLFLKDYYRFVSDWIEQTNKCEDIWSEIVKS